MYKIAKFEKVSFEQFKKDYIDCFNEEDEFKITENEETIYDTMIAIKVLYELTLDDKDEIDLYRNVYYKYVKKNGVHAPIEIEAMTIVENLMRRMYNNSIEMIQEGI